MGVQKRVFNSVGKEVVLHEFGWVCNPRNAVAE